MDNKSEIYRWVAAWIRGDIASDDLAHLERWLDADPRNRKWFDSFTGKENLKKSFLLYSSFHSDKKWKEMEMLCGRREGKIFLSYWKYAAAVAILLFVGILFLGRWNEESHPEVLADQTSRIARQQAILIMESGEEVVLNAMEESCLQYVKGERLSVDNKGNLVSFTDSLLNKRSIEWHTLRIPYGGEYQLLLEDGSRIWLNSASELRYPVHFAKDQRQVWLEGEAYFEIAHNADCPFVVKTAKQNVTVLGTSFDVTAYEDDKNIYTTLLDGSVCVETEGTQQVLNPGEQSVFDGEAITIKEVNAQLYCSWIKDRFVFMSEDFEHVAKKLERWYNVKFVFDFDELKTERFSGSIPKYLELDTVLDMLELTTNIKFEINEKVVHILKKK